MSNTFFPSLAIKSLKHDRKLHRMWHDNRILKQTEQMIVGVNDQTKVTEADGTEWMTKEPAIFCFYAEHWFNVIAAVRDDGVHYYCNLSSPYSLANDAIFYIDYDLDIKVFPDRTVYLLDLDEYKTHKQKYEYPLKIDQKIDYYVSYLYKLIKDEKEPFFDEYIHYWYNMFFG